MMELLRLASYEPPMSTATKSSQVPTISSGALNQGIQSDKSMQVVFNPKTKIYTLTDNYGVRYHYQFRKEGLPTKVNCYVGLGNDPIRIKIEKREIPREVLQHHMESRKEPTTLITGLASQLNQRLTGFLRK